MIPIRARRTTKLTRARVKLELTRAARPATVVVAGILLALGIVSYIGTQVSETLLATTYQVKFAVEDVSGVRDGMNDLRIKGVRAGTITKVEMDGTQPVITAEVDEAYGEIYRNARARLRPNTPLQDMYLDVVDRGTPKAGRAGDDDEPLPADQTDLPVPVADVLNTFQPAVRSRLQSLLDEFGNGLADRGRSLGTAFVQLTPLLRAADRVAVQLARRRPMVKRLIGNTAVLTRSLNERDRELRKLVRGGARALGTLQAGRGDLDSTLRELPDTLSALDSSFAAVRGITGDVDRALVALRPVVERVEPGLRDVRALNSTAAPAVRALQTPIRRLVPLSDALRPLSASLSAAIAALRPQMDTVAKVTRDLASCKKGVQGFFQWDASMVKYGDARGPAPRGNLATGSPAHLRPIQACTPGQAIGGRPAKESDGR
jgi:ABC-type transporter Mla subunit MlaD